MSRKLRSTTTTPLGDAMSDLRKVALSVGLFSFGLNLLLLTSPIFMMQVFDRVLSSGRTETLFFLTLIAIVAMLVLGALEMVRMRVLARAGIWLEKRLAPALIDASVRVRLRGVPVSAQSLRDLDSIRGFVAGPGILAICDAPWVPLFLLVLFVMHPSLGVVGLLAALALFALAIINEYVCRAPFKDEQVSAQRDREAVDQALKNAEVLQAMGMTAPFLARWATRNTATLAAQLDSSERGSFVVGVSKFLRLSVQILILALGAYLVLKHQLTSGGMIAGSIILGRALAPLEQSIAAWKGFVLARQCYTRLRVLFQSARPGRQAMKLPTPLGRLGCEGLIFLPPQSETPVLKGIDFELAPGEALGVVGPSAAGKSTLCRLLVGVWQPSRGHVRLDGADLGNWCPEQLGAHVGYLPQDVELFAGTIKDNIARLAESPEPSRVVEAAKLSGIHDMILKLPKAYDTDIGPEGNFLSGGQRQRIGLARALYGRPRLIVLDEPNANLDSEGEQALLRALEVAKKWGATLIVVAHQPGILRPMDKLLLLMEGQVRYFGPRDEFLGKLHAVSNERPKPSVVAKAPAPPSRMAAAAGQKGAGL